MRRRGRTVLTAIQLPSRPHSTSGPAEYANETVLVISGVPAEWEKYAREPWRILFPDLDWAPPSRDNCHQP